VGQKGLLRSGGRPPSDARPGPFDSDAGWRVDGYPDINSIGKERPSPDGGHWIFYRTPYNGDKSIAFCFFTPFNGA
jgi:hypothetical protein